MSDSTDFGGFDFSSAENTGEESQAPEVPQEEVQSSPNDDSGINPAWNPVLENIPSEFHNVLTPHFKEWDVNYQKGLEKTRSEVQAQYQPYQQFLDNQVDPNQIQQSLELFQILESDPQRVYEALKGQFEQEDPNAQGQMSDEDFSYDPGAVENSPQFQQLQANFNALSEQIQSQQQEQQEQQIYEQELNNIQSTVEDLAPKFQQQYGFEMDREQVLRIAIQNMEMNEGSDLDIPGAANEFAQMVNRYRTPAPPPGQQTPNVLPASGGIPQANFDVTKLNEDQRQDLVAEMLRKAQEQ